MKEEKNPIEIVVKMPVGTTGGFFQFEPVRDRQGLVDLTDLWRRFGAIPNRDPRQWSRKEGKAYLAIVSEDLNVPLGHIYRGQRGRGGATHAYWQVAIRYLQYLSPEAQMVVNRIVMDRCEEEADPELGIRRAILRHARRLRASGRTEEDVEKRLRTVARRNALTSTLVEHGVRGCKDPGRNGFAGVTDALYVGWKGRTAPSSGPSSACRPAGTFGTAWKGSTSNRSPSPRGWLRGKFRRKGFIGPSSAPGPPTRSASPSAS